MRKQQLRETLIEYRFQTIDNSIFPMLDEFVELCDRDNIEDERALAYFLKGEACFRMGIYEDTVDSLNQCLLYHTDSLEGAKLAMSAYNLLGLMFSFMGYEVLALENYFYSVDISKEHKMYTAQAITYVNIGWLYRDLGDYDKALGYYEEAFAALEKTTYSSGRYYNVKSIGYAYMGQLYYKLGEYDKAVECVEAIETMQEKSLYEVSVENLCLQVYVYLGEQEKAWKNLESIIKKASSQDDFLECFEFYADACSFVIEQGMQKEARQLLEGMEQSAKKLDLAYVQLRLKRIEVSYHKSYSTHEKYLSACQDYVAMQEEYQTFINQNKLVGMRNIEAFQTIKKEKEIYREISRHDEMTGLLNKKTLEASVSEYLRTEERSVNAALLVVDLDYFKNINDTAGHLKGDKVIKDVAGRMKEAFSQYSLLGRIGGDEFAVFVREAFDRENIIARAKEFCNAIKELDYSDEPFTVSVSIGIAFAEAEINTYEQLFEIADKALYTAKDLGRGRVYVGKEERSEKYHAGNGI